MIARKITYHGQFNQETIASMYDITRKNEITGFVKKISDQKIELDLEGDPAQIKLIQHQIEYKHRTTIKDKTVEPIPYQYFKGVTFLVNT